MTFVSPTTVTSKKCTVCDLICEEGPFLVRRLISRPSGLRVPEYFHSGGTIQPLLVSVMFSIMLDPIGFHGFRILDSGFHRVWIRLDSRL